MRGGSCGGEGGAGGSDVHGVGGGVYNLGVFAFDTSTVSRKNHASTNNDDVFPEGGAGHALRIPPELGKSADRCGKEGYYWVWRGRSSELRTLSALQRSLPTGSCHSRFLGARLSLAEDFPW
jgi:hypothetical protein